MIVEIHIGAKRSHWKWFIFPQLRGFGTERERALLPHRFDGRGARLSCA